jgi:hypothetical protein
MHSPAVLGHQPPCFGPHSICASTFRTMVVALRAAPIDAKARRKRVLTEMRRSYRFIGALRDGMPCPLSPDEESVRPVLALPFAQHVVAGETPERGYRLVPVEHATHPECPLRAVSARWG